VFEEAEKSPGFLGRALALDRDDNTSNFLKNWGKWGRFEVPSLRCDEEPHARRQAQQGDTCSSTSTKWRSTAASINSSTRITRPERSTISTR
jgi:hypothetical protein